MVLYLCEAPQGSILVPPTFTLYTTKSIDGRIKLKLVKHAVSAVLQLNYVIGALVGPEEGRIIEK